jgi:exonuclease SbcD
MSFNEADQRKQILAVCSQGRSMEVQSIPVPCFQPLVSLRGDLPALLHGLAQLKAAASDAWLELHYQGQEVIPNLREQLLAAVEDSNLSILRIRNSRIYDFALQEAESLDDLTVTEVFERCLEAGQVAEGQRQLIRGAFAEITVLLAQEAQGAD